MTARPTLQDFVEDEMLRAPLAFDQVVDAVLAQWQRSGPMPAKMDVDPARLLNRNRRELVADATRELRRLTDPDRHDAQPLRVAGGETTRHMELSLIDEEEVAADIEVTRAVDRVKQVAEFELRELQTFTSALVDDIHVSRDTNPFHPEAYVRALWQATNALPMARSLRGAFMRDAAEPLARTLKQGYAAACSRLEEQGVEPAAYRTIVVNATTRGGLELPSRHAATLADLRGSLRPPTTQRATAVAPTTAETGKAVVDQQLIEMLTRLFDAMHDDPQLSQSTIALLLRLQPSALRIALRDPGLLDAFEHPAWRFMDQLAFVLETIPASERERATSHCRRLIDQLVNDPATNAARFEWALSRLIELDRHILAQGIAAAQPVIARLRAALDSASMPLDVGTLDTIPAELMPSTEPAPAESIPPASSTLRPGNRLRAYLHGDWRLVQLLWSDPVADIWMLRDIDRDRPWALRRGALDRLLAERLALPLQPRSLARTAAQRVLRALDDDQGAAA